MRILVIAALVFLASPAAQAQRVSNVKGTTLMAACTGKTVQACDAYVDGFSDAIHENGKARALACIPQKSTGTELRDVLVSYLKAHPQDQNKLAGSIVTAAFAKAYPCQK